MSKKIVKLTESDLVRIVKRVLREQEEVSPECIELRDLIPTMCRNCDEIEKFDLPDGTYNGNHSGNLVSFEFEDNVYKVLVEFGVRGQFGHSVEIKDGKPVNLEGDLEGVCGYYKEENN